MRDERNLEENQCVQNVIMYTDKCRLDTVSGLVGGLVELADIVL